MSALLEYLAVQLTAERAAHAVTLNSLAAAQTIIDRLESAALESRRRTDLAAMGVKP